MLDFVKMAKGLYMRKLNECFVFNFKTAMARMSFESTLRSFRLLLCFVSPFVERPEMLRCLCFFSLLSSSGIRRRTCTRRRTGHGSEPCSDDPFATGKSETNQKQISQLVNLKQNLQNISFISKSEKKKKKIL
jgi:hypothetical protein